MKELGDRLKLALKSKGMSQSDLARATGITTSAISRYINTSREPTATIMRKICESLGVSSDYLLGIDGVLGNFERLLMVCKTAGLTTEQRMMLVKALSER